MARFFDPETKQPVTAVYISSSRKGYVVLQDNNLGMRKKPPQVYVYGPGKAKPGVATSEGKSEYPWYLTDLTPQSEIAAVDENGKVVAKIPVKLLHDLPSYKQILARIGRRLLKIDLDSHVDYVYWASPEINEGVYFKAKNSADFKTAIKDTRQFHHDDPSEPIGHLASLATVGAGYREISTPSLHVAIHERVCSVHIDSYDFIITSPWGGTTIQPNMGMHIFDELVLRMPMAWLRRKGVPWLADVLQSIHPVLPNHQNRYSSELGFKIELGRKPDQNWMTGVPRFYMQSTYNFGKDVKNRYKNEASLRLLSGGRPERSPDWVLSAKAIVECPEATCKSHQESVGLYLDVR